jgi:hypothetical protein
MGQRGELRGRERREGRKEKGEMERKREEGEEM